MNKTVIFGGTTEGRRLCEAACGPVVYCVATEDGAKQVQGLPGLDIRVGRLDANAMAALFEREQPQKIIDATHPYAEEASRNIALACEKTGLPLERVERESADEEGCICFETIEALTEWLARQEGNIFAATGATHAKALLPLKERLWIRILPASLQACLDLGYAPERLICGLGPFSETENLEAFKAANAKILVTKNSGAAGGFPEKAGAAKRLGMAIAVLKRPVKT